MNIQFNKVSNVSGELTINMEKADYQPKVEKALKNFAQQAQMPGFRKGKVPMSLIKKMYGVQAKAEEVNRLLQESLFDYIKSNQINKSKMISLSSSTSHWLLNSLLNFLLMIP